jgi:uncharacterized membrane protein
LAGLCVYLSTGKTHREGFTVLFAFVLVVATLVAWAVGHRSATWPDHARRGLAAAMVFAGIGHLVGPQPFVQHLPEWVPAREAIVYLSGIVEIGFGAALVALPARRAATGRLLALFFLAVWPANVYVAVAGVDVDGQPGGAYPWIRLPFQAVFVAWALWSTRATATNGRSGAMTTAPLADRRAGMPAASSARGPLESSLSSIRANRLAAEHKDL